MSIRKISWPPKLENCAQEVKSPWSPTFRHNVITITDQQQEQSMEAYDSGKEEEHGQLSNIITGKEIQFHRTSWVPLQLLIQSNTALTVVTPTISMTLLAEVPLAHLTTLLQQCRTVSSVTSYFFSLSVPWISTTGLFFGPLPAGKDKSYPTKSLVIHSFMKCSL